MGKVIVQDFTCKEPITMIGTEAGFPSLPGVICVFITSKISLSL